MTRKNPKKRGLIGGKFYPPHKGHKALIEFARKQVDELYIIVCHKSGVHEIDGELRMQWLQKTHPDCRVLVIEDRWGDDDYKEWAADSGALLGFIPDVIFSSEHYGEPFAKAFGSQHQSFDPKRNQVPISASEIRKNPFKNWEFLEPCVRAFFCKRVAIVGAESSGKTTLAKDLAKHFQTFWVPEYGRFYCEAKMESGRLNDWESSEFVHIAQEQNRIEDALAERANKVLICDTNAFCTSLWHERYLSQSLSDLEALAKSRRYDLVLLTDVNIPFEQDGTRDGELIRHDMFKNFEKRLKENSIPYLHLVGDREQRTKNAIEAIDQLYLNRSF